MNGRVSVSEQKKEFVKLKSNTSQRVVFKRKHPTVLKREIIGDSCDRSAARRPGSLGATHQVCKVASQCQGCPTVNMSYSEQIELKRALFAESLASARLNERVRIGSFEESADRLNYRKTVKLAVAKKTSNLDRSKSWISIGLYKPGTHDVFDLGFCAVQDKDINGLIQTVKYALKDLDIPIHEQRLEYRNGRSESKIVHAGVRYLFVRKAQTGSALMLTFVVSQLLGSDGSRGEIHDSFLAKLKVAARQIKQRHPLLMSVGVHENSSIGNQIFNHENEFAETQSTLLLGQETYTDLLAGLKLEVHPHSFFQVNPSVAERMYRRIWELAGSCRNEAWIDLYSGIGTIGLGAAQQAAKVLAIEEIGASCAQAKRNAELNQVTNWSCVQGRTEDVLQDNSILRQHLGLGTLGSINVGVVTLNPSRRGCQHEVLRQLVSLEPHTVIYMSCNQETLFRDLGRLEQMGYSTRLLENFDMFPGTTHYETLAIVKPQKST